MTGAQFSGNPGISGEPSNTALKGSPIMFVSAQKQEGFMSENTPVLRILRDAEVEHITGLSRDTRYALTTRGEFPSPVWITSRTRGYLSDEIDAWLESRRDKRTTRQVKPWTPEASRGTTQ